MLDETLKEITMDITFECRVILVENLKNMLSKLKKAAEREGIQGWEREEEGGRCRKRAPRPEEEDLRVRRELCGGAPHGGQVPGAACRGEAREGQGQEHSGQACQGQG